MSPTMSGTLLYSPSSNSLALTNLWEGYSYTKPDGASWADYLSANKDNFCTLDLEQMDQMEAIAVTEQGYYTTSECGRCPIWYYAKL